MRPRKPRFTLKSGKFYSDGRLVPVDPCLIAVCLVSDGCTNLREGVVPEETAARVLRLASAVSMVCQLEEGGLLLGGMPVYAECGHLWEDGRNEPGFGKTSGSKDDLP